MKIVVLNGPRGSGKDTAAQLISEQFENIKIKKMTDPMDRACAKMFGMRYEYWMTIRNDPDLKTKPHPKLHGASPVKILIDMSEKFMKQTFGDDIFGRLMCDEIDTWTSPKKDHNRFVISDGRFTDEILPLMEKYGEKSIMIVQLVRDECEWPLDIKNNGDSEDVGYLNMEFAQMVRIHNNGTKEELADTLKWALGRFFA